MEKQVELTQDQFQKSVEAGAFLRVAVKAGWSHFTVQGQLRGGGVGILVTTRRRVELRRFLNPAAALVLLRKMGVMQAEVQMEGWDLDLTSVSMRMRPDVTARRLRDRRIAEARYSLKPERDVDSGELSREGERDRLITKKARDAMRSA